ncbi:hypothetical protein ACEUYU_004451 [Vibrio vulnificus]|nr:hypothetical protein [Vibrio vulnificus]
MRKIENNVVSDDGKVLLYSIDNFVKNICNKTTCFICGVDDESAEFNDEHIIPRWVLKRYGLFGKEITLPNGRKFRYGKYKIPCCKKCNSLLGNGIEKKISEGFNGDFKSSKEFFNKNKELVFVWICLLYVKTHLKDRHFKFDFKSDKIISDDYDWEGLHHTHCMARSIYTDTKIDRKVYGTMYIYECDSLDHGEAFDYIDLYGTSTVLVRLGGLCLICAIGDSQIVRHLLKSRTDRITGKLNFLQMRELYSRLTYEYLRIIDKPKFFSIGNFEDKFLCIMSSVKQDIRISNHDESLLGSIMYKLVENYIFKPTHPELVEKMNFQVEAVKNGQWTYLFDSEGKFLEDSEFIIDDEEALFDEVNNGTDLFNLKNKT